MTPTEEPENDYESEVDDDLNLNLLFDDPPTVSSNECNVTTTQSTDVPCSVKPTEESGPDVEPLVSVSRRSRKIKPPRYFKDYSV